MCAAQQKISVISGNKEDSFSKAIALMMFTVLCWGGWMVVSRYGVMGNLTPYDITALRFGTAGLLMLPIVLKKGLKIGRQGLLAGIILAILMGAPYNLMTISAFKFAPTAHGALVYVSAVIFSGIFGYFILKEVLKSTYLLGVSISIAGIVAILLSNSNISEDIAQMSGAVIGDFLLITAGVLWGGYTILTKKWGADPLHTTAVVCVLSMCMYLPIYFMWLPSTIDSASNFEIGLQAVYQGLITNVLALYAYNRGVKALGAAYSGIFIPLVPALGTIIAIPALGENPSPLEWAGTALACVGVLVASGALKNFFLRQKAKKSPILQS
jgi:drug/metabolite transporter (DMT)-like permease